MIHACFNFDEDTDEIVKIPREEDPYYKIHDVEFRELTPENIDEAYMEVKLGRYVLTHYRLRDGRYAFTCVFFDEPQTGPREPGAKCGSSQRCYEEDQDLDHTFDEDPKEHFIVWLKGRK